MQRTILLRPLLKQTADEASSASSEPQFITYLLEQCKSTEPSSLRQAILHRYSFYVENVEIMPVGLVLLATRGDRVSVLPKLELNSPDQF